MRGLREYKSSADAVVVQMLTTKLQNLSMFRNAFAVRMVL